MLIESNTQRILLIPFCFIRCVSVSFIINLKYKTMLIKEAVYKKVKVTQNKLVTYALYGCDECQQEIENYPNEDQRLEMKVFHKHSEETDTLHFCSWDCALKHIPKINTDYFVDLPFIYFDSPEGSKRGANHLVKLIRERFLNER